MFIIVNLVRLFAGLQLYISLTFLLLLPDTQQCMSHLFIDVFIDINHLFCIETSLNSTTGIWTCRQLPASRYVLTQPKLSSHHLHNNTLCAPRHGTSYKKITLDKWTGMPLCILLKLCLDWKYILCISTFW